MTADDFRQIALAQPEAEEVGHHGHPDFRLRNRIFATLGYPNAEWAVLKLAPDEQLALVAAMPQAFVPVKGTWGERGATSVRLAFADDATVRQAMQLAWANAGRAAPAKKTLRRRSRIDAR